MVEAYYQPEPKAPVQTLDSLNEIEEAHKRAATQTEPHCKLWITLTAANREELDWLHNQLGIHPLVIEDIEKRNQRSKLDEYPDYLFAVLHRPYIADSEIEWEELHMIMNKHWLVSSIDADDEYLQHKIKLLAAQTYLFDKGLGSLIYHLCDNVVSAFFPIMDDYEDQVDDIEDELIESPQQSMLNKLFGLKRNLVEMRRYLGPQRDVFRVLLDRTDFYFDDQARLYIRDVYDQNIRVYDSLDTLRDQVGNATDLYLSVVNNNMNVVMKRLTAITTIFLPITFVTGVFGMNFGHSPQVDGDPGWFFWACIIGLIAIASGVYYLLKRRDMI